MTVVVDVVGRHQRDVGRGAERLLLDQLEPRSIAWAARPESAMGLDPEHRREHDPHAVVVGRAHLAVVAVHEQEARAFVGRDAHAEALRRFRGWAAAGACFAEWQMQDAKIDWQEALGRLEQPTYRYDSRA